MILSYYFRARVVKLVPSEEPLGRIDAKEGKVRPYNDGGALRWANGEWAAKGVWVGLYEGKEKCALQGDGS